MHVAKGAAPRCSFRISTTGRITGEAHGWKADTPNEMFLMIAIDAYSRLPVTAASSATADHIAAELDRAGQRLGYPEEIWIDPGFEFSTPALKEWGVQRGIEIVYG
jgi:hypothetical protein